MGERRVGLVYDERMCAHANPWQPSHPETPERILAIAERLKSAGVFQRCVHMEAREAIDDELKTVHTQNYIDLIRGVSSRAYGKEGRKGLAGHYNSIYFNEGSSESALLAAGSVVELSLQVAQGELGAGAAIVRPPGHHAEADAAMGFCLFNNVAVAAHVLVHGKPELGIHKILIVDWDVHHGNGTQRMFWNDPQVLYFSVHRYDKGSFYPVGNEGNYDMVGAGDGAGFNINVPWPHGGFGDSDYLAVWDHVLLPIAKTFRPDMVLISGGFDSAEGDPLGGCRLTPYGYSQMTLKLLDLAKGRVVLALEGGYNLNSIAESYLSCLKILLGDQPANCVSFLPKPFASTWLLIHKVREALHKFWPSLIEFPDSFQRKILEVNPISLEERLSLINMDEQDTVEDFADEDDASNEERYQEIPTKVGISVGDEESHSKHDENELLGHLIEQMGELITNMQSESETGTQKQGEPTIDRVPNDILKDEHESLLHIDDEASDYGQRTSGKTLARPDSILMDEDSIIQLTGIEKENMYIWYASYGTNMWGPRFLCYLEGGQAEGMARNCVGSRNKSPPIATKWMQVEHQLFFGHSYTSTWGHGGVAFLELKPTNGVSTHVRLYKITVEQFSDLFMQENRMQTCGTDLIDASFVHSLHQQPVASNSFVLLKEGWYGTVLYLGENDGCPILTFTCPESDAEKFKSGSLPLCSPSEAYQWTVARGLVEHMGLSKEAALNYVSSKVEKM